MRRWRPADTKGARTHGVSLLGFFLYVEAAGWGSAMPPRHAAVGVRSQSGTVGTQRDADTRRDADTHLTSASGERERRREREWTEAAGRLASVACIRGRSSAVDSGKPSNMGDRRKESGESPPHGVAAEPKAAKICRLPVHDRVGELALANAAPSLPRHRGGTTWKVNNPRRSS